MRSVESPTRIEPCGIEESVPIAFTDLILKIGDESDSIGHNLHPRSAGQIRGLIRIMNAYYSGLIEGHDTKPIEIEEALRGKSLSLKNRPLIEEALAHIEVQEWIDSQITSGRDIRPYSIEFIKDVHKRFYANLPEESRTIKNGDKNIVIVPGEFRTTGQEVVVGRHHPPSGEVVEEFMSHFQKRYHALTRGRTGRVLSIPAAHHRLAYVHPFLDGNGRVARLMSHAMIGVSGLGGHGLWSISRGLARGLTERSEYMRHMDSADSPRMGDRDGRGNLSMRRLHDFTAWFLTVMLDQIRFTSHMLDFKSLDKRYITLVDRVFPEQPRKKTLVHHALKHGYLSRKDAAFIAGASERTVRDDTAALLKIGFLISDGQKGDLNIGFPADYRETLLPNFFTPITISPPEPPEIPTL